MFAVIVIIILGFVAWAIRNKIVDSTRASQVEYLLQWSKKCFDEGQTREWVYNTLLELRQEKKYSEYVINKVIIYLLWALVKELINQGWANPQIRQTLKQKGYHEWYIERAIEMARENK